MPTVDSPSTSTSMLNQMRNGEQLAWFRFVQVYTPLLEFWSRQQGIRKPDSEDIIQNVFVAVSQHIEGYGRDGLESNFRAWLWTITRSKIIDHFRCVKKSPKAISVDLLGTCAAPDRLFEAWNASDSAKDLNVLINGALEVIRSDFSPQTWTAFWQTCAMGRPASEVAKELDMSAAAVCMCRARVMRRLRETIDHF